MAGQIQVGVFVVILTGDEGGESAARTKEHVAEGERKQREGREGCRMRPQVDDAASLQESPLRVFAFAARPAGMEDTGVLVGCIPHA